MRTAAALASVGLLLSCAPAETAREDFIAETLQQRARHVRDTDRDAIAQGLIHSERHTGVDALLLLAVAEEESHYKPGATSRRGALGVLQVRPHTGRAVCERNRLPWDGEAALFEPSFNILVGATYLAELRERFGSWDLALTAYNQGPSRAARAATRGRRPSSRYAARILRRFESLNQQAGEATGHGRAAN